MVTIYLMPPSGEVFECLISGRPSSQHKSPVSSKNFSFAIANIEADRPSEVEQRIMVRRWSGVSVCWKRSCCSLSRSGHRLRLDLMRVWTLLKV